MEDEEGSCHSPTPMGNLCTILQVNFRELLKGEVRGIPLLGTPVNKGKKKGRESGQADEA